MFLRKHKGEEILPVKTEEEIAKEQLKALEATLDFLNPSNSIANLDNQQEESSEHIEGEDDTKEATEPTADMVTETLDSSTNIREAVSKAVTKALEEPVEISTPDVSLKEEVASRIETFKAESEIDRTKYPAYKPISDDIKRSGRFGRRPSVNMQQYKPLVVNASEAKDLSEQILPEESTENITEATEADITEKNIETDTEVTTEIAGTEASSSKSENDTEGTTAPNLIVNPLPTPKKHEHKEMDFDYEVKEEELYFDREIFENNEFDIE